VQAAHLVVENDRLLFGFAHGTTLEVLELQMEGKKRMSARDFVNGYRPRSDEPLGATA
jgi:methionyl-tRNA formyltransferase